jgi:hypothetical protein
MTIVAAVTHQAADLREVADILTWKQASNTPAFWRTRYEDLLERYLQSLAGENREDALCILEAVALLPRPRQRAFLRAPLVASRLLAHRKGETFEAGPIVKSLMAELTLAGNDCDLFEPVWTVLGDRRIEPAGAEMCIAVTERIANTDIVIDKAGPVDFSARQGSRLASPSVLERISAERTIAEAAGGIRATSETAFDLWRECVDAVAVRTSAEPGAAFSSVSLAYNAGVSLLINTHVADASPAVVADALLHEAIHSLLFIYEEIAGPFVTDVKATEEVRIVSPWTGKTLALPAFLHACLVWYGLYWFWSMAMARQTWPTQQSRHFLELARGGFDRHPLSMIPPHCRMHLSAAIVSTLGEIKAKIDAA